MYVRCLYALWSYVYDAVLDRLFHFDRQSAIDALDIHEDERVLELGVGTGLNLQYYPECAVVAVDFSKHMLARARKKPTKARVQFKVADIMNIPCPDRYFDKALATFMFRIVPDPRRAFGELYRVLKTGARVVIVDTFDSSWFDSVTAVLGWGRNLEWSMLERFQIIEKRRIGAQAYVVVLEKKRIDRG